MSEILVISRRELRAHLTLETLIAPLEQAFIDFAEGRTLAYPVVREEVAAHRGIFGIKSGYLQRDELIGLKAGGFWLGNPGRNLTAHQSTTMLFDPRTGVPLAVMDGNHITTVRTAAVGAIAARVLARGDSHVAAVLGCGVQGTAQAEALCHVLPVTEIRAFDVHDGNLARFIDTLGARADVRVIATGDAETAVRGADVVVTAVGGRSPVLQAGWIAPGTHVSAFGTDTRGKIEIDPAVFTMATLVVDDEQQARTIGETQHAVAAGILAADATLTTLGEILAGRATGRRRVDEVTLFDATGLAFQDIVAGSIALGIADARGIGQRIALD